MNLDYLKRQLIRHEGYKNKPYRDSKGKLTIGIGHNLDDKGLTDVQIDEIYQDDVRDALKDLADHLNWAMSLDEARQMVLVNMVFNMGVTKLLGFHQMLLALQSGDYGKAAEEMKNSAWHNEVGARALELEHQMSEGVLL